MYGVSSTPSLIVAAQPTALLRDLALGYRVIRLWASIFDLLLEIFLWATLAF
jgi:hypothetical protein